MDFISLARNPVPSGAILDMFAGYDGAQLRYARWEPTRGPRRGTVCICPGRGEFIEKYFETIADLRRRGFAVAIFDWRGQGGSYRALKNPHKGHINDFSEYVRDLERFMKDVVQPECLPPFYALGHSMGGNVLLRHASRSKQEASGWFERLVLTAPLIAFSDQRIGYPQSFVRNYARVASLVGFSSRYVVGGSDDPFDGQLEFEGNVLTSDINRWERNVAILRAVPDWSLGSPTIGWLRAAYRSCAVISSPNFANQVKIPTLMFAAGRDQLVSTQAIEEFGVRLKVGSHLLIPNSRHEILQEADDVRQYFWSVFDAYINAASAAA
ncbi:MAG: alpha/beta fold hydrolase [Hyphomicrobiaceae bacterium]